MKFRMLIATSITSVMTFASVAQAQQSWGSGLFGGMQSCNYAYEVAAGSTSYIDDIKEAQAEIQNAQKQLREKEAAVKKLNRVLERAQKSIDRVISEDYADLIFNHMQNRRRCDAYAGMASIQNFSTDGDEGGQPLYEDMKEDKPKVEPFLIPEWKGLCEENKSGSVKGKVCEVTKYREDGSRVNASFVKACKDGLTEYRRSYVDQQKLQGEIDDLKLTIETRTQDIADYKQAFGEEVVEVKQQMVEGTFCWECAANSGYRYERPQSNIASIVGNVALGLGSYYIDSQTQRAIARSNAEIGHPTYTSGGLGYTIGALATAASQVFNGGSDIYGSADSGIASGAFGCSGNNGGVQGILGPLQGANGQSIWGNPHIMADIRAGGQAQLPGYVMGPNGQVIYNPAGQSQFPNYTIGANGQVIFNPAGQMQSPGYVMGPSGQVIYNPAGQGQLPGYVMGPNGQVIYNPNGQMQFPSYPGGALNSNAMQIQLAQMQADMQRRMAEMEAYSQYVQQQNQRQQAYQSIQQEIAALTIKANQLMSGNMQYSGTLGSSTYGINNYSLSPSVSAGFNFSAGINAGFNTGINTGIGPRPILIPGSNTSGAAPRPTGR